MRTRPSQSELRTCRRRSATIALPHVFKGTAHECSVCRQDPVLVNATWDCPCSTRDIERGHGTCRCGIVWHFQDNGPTRAVRFATAAHRAAAAGTQEEGR